MNLQDYLKKKLNEKWNEYDHVDDYKQNTDVDKSQNVGADAVTELEKYVKEQYDQYVPKTNEPPTYERYEYDMPTDKEIEEAAKNELTEYANSEQSIKDKYAAKADELEKSKSSSEKLLSDSAQKLRSAFDETTESLSNDALKRGLSRSSIAINKQAQAGETYNNNLSDLIAARNQKMTEIDDELRSLDSQLADALDSFKISYAAKLQTRINELKQEREKNSREAIKYNNSLLSQEYEQRKNVPTLTKEQMLNSISNKDRAQMEYNIYEKVVDTLDQLPASQARELFLSDPFFRENLSDYYYYKLYYKYREN